MSDLEFLTGKNYMSHSSLTSWLGCGERFRLERIVQVPQEKSWWLLGGSAFHTATEWLDKGEEESAVQAWNKAWAKQWADDEFDKVDLSKVRAGGRKSKDWPDKENQDWWLANGPQMVFAYVAWRQGEFARGSQWLELPDGSPAIELAIQLELEGVLVKGYIDRVMVTADGELKVVDLKTGSHTPASSLQLGIYALGVERHLGVKPILGAYYMARKGELTDDTSLLHYTPELVGKWFASAKKGIEAEVFVPNVSSMCGTCSVRPYCTAFGAPLAHTLSSTTIATSS